MIVPDLLGFGRSSDPPGDFHAPGQAAALLDLLTTLGTPSVHVVGFDFGGPIALTVYGLAPERVLSLTLAATNAFPDTPIPPPLGAARIPVVGELLFGVLCSWPGLAGLWLNAVADKRAVTWLEFVRLIPDRRGRRWTRRTFLESLRHLPERYAAVEAILPAVQCPAAVVWGDSDPFFPVSVGERTAAAVPHSTLHVLERCGHFIPHERPEALAAAILGAARSRRQDVVQHLQQPAMP